MRKALIYLLPVLSGLLMAFSWPETGGLSAMFFFALVPLLFFEHFATQEGGRFLKIVLYLGGYVTFFLFNFLTTSWIRFASLPGMIMAEVLNSAFMAFIFLLFHLSKKRIGERPAYFAFMIFWIAFEWIHYHWELSWVWLTFGNVFAKNITWIQWYEYTGVLGGSLWIWMANILVFFILRKWNGWQIQRRQVIVNGVILLLWIAFPMFWSNYRYHHYEEKEDPVNIVVVQPNIDPYHDKFYGMAESDQIDLLADLASGLMDQETDFMVCPETAFPMGYWEHELEYMYGVERMRELLTTYPNLRIVTGLSSKRMYTPGEKPSATARQFRDGTENFYDFYNTAMQLDTTRHIQLYHKSKLVLGVEKMPFGTLLKPLEKLSINLGGASGSLGHEKEALNFEPNFSASSQQPVAPVICYESVYGEYIGEYVNKGAELIFIITNDGWWDNTAGHRQHLTFASLRAIEMRRSIARSANTGISAFINQRGDILQPTKWWTRLAIKDTINANQDLTFYARNGDFIGRVAAFFSALLVVLLIVRSIRKKSKAAVI